MPPNHAADASIQRGGDRGTHMLIFEQLVSRGFMVLDADRKVLTFNREVVGEFPSIGKQKIQEAGWLLGTWVFENRVRATPTTPAYSDTFIYRYQLCDDQTRICILGPGGKLRPHLTFDPFSHRWMMTFTDALYGVLQSEGWRGNTIVFTGPLTMLGVDCQLRQTITGKNDDEFHILNEEKLPDGGWQVTDEFNCRRKQF
jgi:hypothetical protein